MESSRLVAQLAASTARVAAPSLASEQKKKRVWKALGCGQKTSRDMPLRSAASCCPSRQAERTAREIHKSAPGHVDMNKTEESQRVIWSMLRSLGDARRSFGPIQRLARISLAPMRFLISRLTPWSPLLLHLLSSKLWWGAQAKGVTKRGSSADVHHKVAKFGPCVAKT